MNWLDYLILLVLFLGAVNGFREGFTRLVIGFVALVLGFLFASWFHGLAGSVLNDYIHNPMASTVVAWSGIFLLTLLAGALVAGLIVRIFKLVGLSPVDRILGAAVGSVRACVSLAVAAMVLMAFTPDRMPTAVRQSELAPYFLQASRWLSAMTPYGIRNGVEKSYAEFRNQLDRFRKE